MSNTIPEDEQGPELASSDDSLEHLVAQALDRLDKEGEAGIESLCQQHPQHREALLETIQKLRNLGLLKEERRDPKPSLPEGSYPERFGEFRLIEKLGSGGMGVVFVAEQESLGRRVALKMVRPELLYFPGHAERFRREVDAVARMQHPGIVPIYSVGEEQGIPYFAMELIEGCSLAETLAFLRGRKPEPLTGMDLLQAIHQKSRGRANGSPPDSIDSGIGADHWVDTCCRMVRLVAEALDHTHSRGVVHRDVKPSNIALTRTGRPLLLDFGLAKRQGISPITRTGSQPGSVPYMSPEQLRGDKEVDLRTDIYSLGVTFYEALTLKSAFASESIDVTRERILAGEFTRPRVLNRAIAWDAERVCLTAMELDPARRYASAGDFARDLGNLLLRRPIEARRPGPWLRLLRYAQRHPTRSMAAMVGMVLALIAALLLANQREKHASEMTVERNIARERFNEIRQISSSFLFEFDSAIKDLPGSNPARRLVVNKAILLLQQLSLAAEEDPSLREDLATAHSSLSGVLFELGDSEACLKHLEKAGVAFQQLLSVDSSNLIWIEGLWCVHWRSGNALRLLGQSQPAMDSLNEALSIAERMLSFDASNPISRRHVATTLQQLAKSQYYLGKMEAGLANIRRAVESYESLLQADPTNSEYRFELSFARVTLADLLADNGLSSQAEEEYRKAREESEALVLQDPNNARFCNLASMCSSVMAKQLLQTGEIEEALRVSRHSVEIAERLYAAEPNDVSYAERLARAWLTDGDVCDAAGKAEEALESYEHAIQTARTWSNVGRDMMLRESLAEGLSNVGDIQSRLGDAEEALARYTEALELYEEILAEDPNDVWFQCRRLFVFGRRGIALGQLEDLEEARRILQSALEQCESLLQHHSDHRDLRHALAWLTKQLAYALQLSGEDRDALEQYQCAAQRFEDLWCADPTSAVMRSRLVNSLEAWRGFALECGHSEEEIQAIAEAERALKASNAEDPEVLDTLAYVWFMTGDGTRALQMEERALALGPSAELRAQIEAHQRRFQEALETEKDR